MNVSTAIVLAIVVACICLAVRFLRKKGMCGCKKHCSSECSASSCSSCLACSAVDGVADALDKVQVTPGKR